MSFSYKQEALRDYKGYKYTLVQNEKVLAFDEVIHLWSDSPEFKEFYSNILKDSEFDAYFWEHPALKKTSLKKDYQFVLINSNVLAKVKVDILSFRKKFTKDSNITSFSNLGGDAVLVVPNPVGDQEDYTHLAKFIRNAPSNQVAELWTNLSVEINKALTTEPKWLSTSGLGVYWLHLRIDNRPKYYQYLNYRNKD